MFDKNRTFYPFTGGCAVDYTWLMLVDYDTKNEASEFGCHVLRAGAL
jgi:hypothetical protein